jgi:hypothetical protein
MKTSTTRPSVGILDLIQGGVSMTSKITLPSDSRELAAHASQTSGQEVAEELVLQAIRSDCQEQAAEYLRESVAPFGGE